MTLAARRRKQGHGDAENTEKAQRSADDEERK